MKNREKMVNDILFQFSGNIGENFYYMEKDGKEEFISKDVIISEIHIDMEKLVIVGSEGEIEKFPLMEVISFGQLAGSDFQLDYKKGKFIRFYIGEGM